jgi:Family of unknown function (DUF5362)
MSILDETLAHNFDDNSGLVVTNNMKRNWITTSKWAMFFAILGFIWIGFSLLSMGSAASTLQMMQMMGGDNPIFEIYGMLMPFLTVITLVVVAVMFFIHFFHLRFATQIQRAVNFTDQAAFVNAWKNLRNHFRLYGILVCVALVFYAIMFIVMFTVMAGKDSLPME